MSGTAEGVLAGGAADRGGWRWLVAVAFGLVALVVGAFWPVLGADFVRFDDPKVLTENPFVQGLSGENLRWMFFRTHMGHYQPLTWLSYAIEHALWGLSPRGYHAVNLGLHAANAILVFVLARHALTVRAPGLEQSRRTIMGPAAAAAIWALHPLRVESVAWVTERRDVLSALFLIAASITYLRAFLGGDSSPRIKPRLGWYAVTIVLLTLSLLGKAWGMSFFVLAMVLDAFVLRRVVGWPWAWDAEQRRTALRAVIEKLPMAILGVAAAAMAAHAQSASNATKTLAEWGVQARLVQAVDGLWFYMHRTFVPRGLSVLYELPPQTQVSFASGSHVLAAGGVVAAAGVAVLLGRRWPGVFAAAAAYLVLLLPVLGVLQSGDQLVADRYSYLALIGWMVAVGAGVEMLWSRRSLRGPLLAGVAVVVLLLAMATHRQSRVWKDTESLWTHAARVTPTPTVITNQGMELARLGRVDEAIGVLQRATDMDPMSINAWLLIGNIHRDARRFAQAEAAFLAAAKHPTQGFMGRVNLGGMYLQHMNRSADGIEQMRMAVAEMDRAGTRPESAMPLLALGRALRSTGDTEGAKTAFRRAMSFDDTAEQARRELVAMGEEPGQNR